MFIYDALIAGKLITVIDGLYWQAIAYASLLLGLSIFPWKILVNKFTTFIGLVSYSVYLSHTTVIVAFASIYSSIYLFDIPTSFKFFLSTLITLSIVIAVSYISYRMIEEPGMRLGRWLIRKYQADAASKTRNKIV